MNAAAAILAVVVFIATTTCTDAAAAAAASTPPSFPGAPSKKVKLLQVQVVHRHGDRTPITPMKNETYWKGILPPQHVLDGISKGTRLVGDGNSAHGSTHAAAGRGPFGQLSQLGLLQMVGLGSKLRKELHFDDDEDADNDANNLHHEDEHGHQHINKGKLFHAKAPIHPQRIKVTSTNFPRTVQSVQGLLVGLFPDGTDDHHIEIDVTKTNKMIPDPQPRRTAEQMELERKLAARPHLAEREEEMRDLRTKASDALRDALGEGYDKVNYGVGEEENDDGTNNEYRAKPLSWSQLAEITTCLRARNLLPESITEADQEAISAHAAWRWFENLRHPRLARLAMHDMTMNIVDGLHKSKSCARTGTEEDEPLLHIYSAHDSTLIGLLCAFHLQQPSQWPEYASFIKVELIEVEDVGSSSQVSEKDYYVRFSLNGEVLRSSWSMDENGELHDLLSLDRLTEMVNKEHHDDEIAVTIGAATAVEAEK
mmetsp:Transcript_25065/g.54654  ORF Transcript_25065/g.54654 Transcript_25065/m.54654 type:complete len:483 (+) Transcript_25065:133-1581(+)